MRDGWRQTTLGEAVEVTMGRQRSPTHAVGEHMLPYLRAANVKDGRLQLDSVFDMNFSPAEQATFSLRPGDVLVTEGCGSIGQLGAAARWDGEIGGTVCFQNTLLRLRAVQGVTDPGFVDVWARHAFSSGIFAAVASGTNIFHIGSTQVKRIPFLLPPLAEQRRIADVAGAVDHMERLAATLAQEADSARAAFEESSLPMGQPHSTVPLGDIAEVVSGVTKDAKRQADPSFVEVPYVRVANLQRGYLDLDDVATIRVPERRALQLRLRPGDILFNEGGDRDKLGRGWVWEGQIERCIHQNHVLRARLLDEAFDPRFVSICGNTYGRQWFEAMGSQTTNLASLNLSTLKRFPVPILPVEGQRLLVEGSDAFRSLARQATSVAEAARDLRLAVLADLLSGTHVIPDSYNALLESAS